MRAELFLHGWRRRLSTWTQRLGDAVTAFRLVMRGEEEPRLIPIRLEHRNQNRPVRRPQRRP